MRAQLGNPSMFDHRDPVGVMGGMQPVGGRDHRATCEHGGKRTLRVASGARVERRRRFVEGERPQIDEQQAGEGQLLAWGAERLTPPEPTRVSSPSGSAAAHVSAITIAGALNAADTTVPSNIPDTAVAVAVAVDSFLAPGGAGVS